MIGSTSPHTAILFRAYYGLLAVSIALSGVLATRPAATTQNAPHAIVKPAQRDANVARPANPSGQPSAGINWGGQKR